MGTPYFGSTSTFPRENHDFVGASSGGSLDDSDIEVQFNWDDAVFTNDEEGKQRLINGLRHLGKRLMAAKEWPITSAS